VASGGSWCTLGRGSGRSGRGLDSTPGELSRWCLAAPAEEPEEHPGRAALPEDHEGEPAPSGDRGEEMPAEALPRPGDHGRLPLSTVRGPGLVTGSRGKGGGRPQPKEGRVGGDPSPLRQPGTPGCRCSERFYRNRLRSASNESSRRAMSARSSYVVDRPPSVIRKYSRRMESSLAWNSRPSVSGKRLLILPSSSRRWRATILSPFRSAIPRTGARGR